MVREDRVFEMMEALDRLSDVSCERIVIRFSLVCRCLGLMEEEQKHTDIMRAVKEVRNG